MKTIGLIGGISWVSSAQYYKLINEQVARHLGGSHSAKCILYSVDFNEIETLQHKGDWAALHQMMREAATSLEKAGADCILICANTMHLSSDAIREVVSIPLLHIAEATALSIKKAGLTKIALLGTKFTMEKDFFKDILKEHGIAPLVPSEEDRAIVHNVIYKELVKGNINASDRKEYQLIIKELEQKGAQGVILGCTEIPLLIKQEDVDIPTFDTTTIHATSAVDFALDRI